MAHFGKDVDNFSATRTIRIVGVETNEKFTTYIIEVAVGHYVWRVKHRYNDFHDLHDQLVYSCKVDKCLLPPKKMFGNQSESFIKKRQADLEAYLQTMLYYLAHKVPSALATFLQFDKYEIHGITQCMAEELYNRGEILLQSRDPYVVTPLQLYSLTERLKLPEPTCESGDVKKDIGHILDFITRVKCLKVAGSRDRVGTSNIDMTQLKFDLSLFKSLQCLETECCHVSNILGIETIKETLEKVSIRQGLTNIRDLVLNGLRQWKAEDGTVLVTHWDNLVEADFSRNSLSEIDDSVQLIPRVEVLDLSHNRLTGVQHLNWLSQLTQLDLSNNEITGLDSLHTKIGNLKILNLSGNRLESLRGLSKLYSLETLDVRNNKLSQVAEVQYVCCLPCIENLYLQGNPVNHVLDYRTKILEQCGDRVLEVSLDDMKPTQKELDTVAVLQAIRKSKENKAKIGTTRKLSASELQSSGSRHSSLSGTEDKLPATPELGWSTHGSFSATPNVSDVDSPNSSRTGSDASQVKDSSGHSSRTSLTGSEGEHKGEQRPRFRTLSRDDPSTSPTIAISSLPTHQDPEFMAWIQERLFGKDTEPGAIVEQVLNVLWCGVIQFTRQESLVPCCAVLSQRRIFILRLKPGESGYPDVPDIETFYILPLCNVQEIVIGPCYSYIRLEESFVGASGTFVLIAADPDDGKSFSDSITSAYSGGDLGPLNLLNCSQNSDLASHIFSLEDLEGLCTGRIAYGMYITIAGVEQPSLLILSENKVYLVHIDCLFWPRPSFLSVLEDIKNPNFTFLQHHSITAKMSDIKLNVKLKLSSRSKKTSSVDTSLIQFEKYGLSIIFHELAGPVGLHLYFFSTKARDGFLDRLTNLRAEHAHRLSPTIREEPEGGNESSDSLDNTSSTQLPISPPKEPQDEALVEEEKVVNVREENTPDAIEQEFLAGAVTETDEQCSKSRAATVSGVTLKVSTAKEEAVPEIDYLTDELCVQLTTSIQNYSLAKKMPSKLKVLRNMTGKELVQYFHSDIAMIGVDYEQLHFVLWSVVIPYDRPHSEIISCVMLSTKAVYFVSNQLVKSPMKERQSWMTHTRHKSDSIVLGQQPFQMDPHHTSGIIHNSQRGTIIRPYHILKYSDLHQVNVGLFDQCVRLTGHDRHTVNTLVTRDSAVTEKFLNQLTTMLSIFTSSPMLDKSSSDLEQDFYRAFERRTKTVVDGMEYVHPSKVQFIYPGEDVMSDLLYIITEHLKLPVTSKRKADILMYWIGYLATEEHHAGSVDHVESRSMVLTNQYLCFILEDVINYPIPDFARGLPNSPRYKVTNTMKISHLKRVLMFKDNEHKLSLIFSDEPDEINVDTSSDHFSLENNSSGRLSPPEIETTILVQSPRDINKFMLLLKNQWREVQDGEELEVHLL
ncbi:nischarin-like isoform X2 [Saccostrea cucullata]|uniref:nischarin-like isoform X2 n=2 Tax=Saccostrea cuccullata TaxID=36930 RepID=UPI002ED49EBA